jgi:hypothetical protein
MSDSFEQIRKLKDELQKVLETTGKSAFREKFQTFFDLNPDVVEVRWKQYTPYFNDGDSCIFGVGDPTIKFKDTEEDGGDYGDGFEESYNSDKKAVFKALQDLNVFDEDICKTIFGDHVRITINRKYITVEEYEHE